MNRWTLDGPGGVWTSHWNGPASASPADPNQTSPTDPNHTSHFAAVLESIRDTSLESFDLNSSFEVAGRPDAEGWDVSLRRSSSWKLVDSVVRQRIAWACSAKVH